jgi:hypothetical protein
MRIVYTHILYGYVFFIILYLIFISTALPYFIYILIFCCADAFWDYGEVHSIYPKKYLLIFIKKMLTFFVPYSKLYI